MAARALRAVGRGRRSEFVTRLCMRMRSSTAVSHSFRCATTAAPFDRSSPAFLRSAAGRKSPSQSRTQTPWNRNRAGYEAWVVVRVVFTFTRAK
eukprot:8322472-Pyramimonas_sp.AAC.1